MISLQEGKIQGTPYNYTAYILPERPREPQTRRIWLIVWGQDGKTLANFICTASHPEGLVIVGDEGGDLPLLKDEDITGLCMILLCPVDISATLTGRFSCVDRNTD